MDGLVHPIRQVSIKDAEFDLSAADRKQSPGEGYAAR